MRTPHKNPRILKSEDSLPSNPRILKILGFDATVHYLGGHECESWMQLGQKSKKSKMPNQHTTTEACLYYNYDLY